MNKPSFAQTLRGARLGYHWHDQLGAYFRISDDGPHRFAISIRPTGTIKGRSEHVIHRCWWEGPDPIEMMPMCAGVKNVKRPMDFSVDEEGRLIA